MLQVCKVNAPAGTCLGALLTYSDGTREAMGEIRFDRYMTDKMDMQSCFFCNMEIDKKHYVLLRGSPSHGDKRETDEWCGFPTNGEII